MKINTRKFGELEIDEDKILTMPAGLPGFPGFEQFVLFEDKNAAPFCWFQSIESPSLSLVVMNPVVFKPDYQLSLQVNLQDNLQANLHGLVDSKGWKNVKPEELLIFVVINIKEGKHKESEHKESENKEGEHKESEHKESEHKESENEKSITANLMGPLVINLENREVIQMVISDSDYSHKYDVLKAL